MASPPPRSSSMSTPESTTALRSCMPPPRPRRISSPSPACRATSTPQHVGINTRAVLELAGRLNVEVAMGRPIPLVRPLETTPETHGPQGLGYAELPPPSKALCDRHAVDLILEEARRRPGEITLVTLGPLTNLALAVLREPALAAPAARLCADGRGVRRVGQHDADDRMEHPLRPGGGTDRLSRLGRRDRGRPGHPPCHSSSASMSRSRPASSTEHVVRLARRAGSTPDDSIDLDARRRPDASRCIPSPRNPVVRYVADALRFYFEFHGSTTGSTARSSTTRWPWRPPWIAGLVTDGRPRRRRRDAG